MTLEQMKQPNGNNVLTCGNDRKLGIQVTETQT